MSNGLFLLLSKVSNHFFEFIHRHFPYSNGIVKVVAFILLPCILIFVLMAAFYLFGFWLQLLFYFADGKIFVFTVLTACLNVFVSLCLGFKILGPKDKLRNAGLIVFPEISMNNYLPKCCALRLQIIDTERRSVWSYSLIVLKLASDCYIYTCL